MEIESKTFFFLQIICLVRMNACAWNWIASWNGNNFKSYEDLDENIEHLKHLKTYTCDTEFDPKQRTFYWYLYEHCSIVHRQQHRIRSIKYFQPLFSFRSACKHFAIDLTELQVHEIHIRSMWNSTETSSLSEQRNIHFVWWSAMGKQ